MYLSMSIGSPWNGKMAEYLSTRHGKIDAETGLSLMRDLGTGNVQAVLYDFAHRQVRVANASVDKIPAYKREFVTYDLDQAEEKFARYDAAMMCEEAVIILPRPGLDPQRRRSAPDKQSIWISYKLDRDEHIDIAIFDTLGNPVASLFSGLQMAGSHQISWDGKGDLGHDVPIGLYPCKLKSGPSSETLKLVRIK